MDLKWFFFCVLNVEDDPIPLVSKYPNLMLLLFVFIDKISLVY